MAEIKVKEIMSSKVITIPKNLPVKEVAKVFIKEKIGGAPVVDEKGKVVGMITENDLIMQDVKIHFPTYIHLLDGFFYLGSLKRFEEQLKKAVGAKAEDLMSKNVIWIKENDTVEDAATLMVEKGVSRLPVSRKGKLVGIVSKADILRVLTRA